MKYFLQIFALPLVLVSVISCTKNDSSSGPAKANGDRAVKSLKIDEINLKDYPNVKGTVCGSWSTTSTVSVNKGPEYNEQVRIYVNKTYLIVRMTCSRNGKLMDDKASRVGISLNDNKINLEDSFDFGAGECGGKIEKGAATTELKNDGKDLIIGGDKGMNFSRTDESSTVEEELPEVTPGQTGGGNEASPSATFYTQPDCQGPGVYVASLAECERTLAGKVFSSGHLTGKACETFEKPLDSSVICH